ncbi:MAG: pilT [Firmicutes bacterium]|nr:pilT [Bacillota bacterium]
MMIDLLWEAVQRGASDLHLTMGLPPMLRINGSMLPLEAPCLSFDDTKECLLELASEQQNQLLAERGEIDFSYAIDGLGRFRINAFRRQGTVAIAIRVIPSQVMTLEQLGLPETVKDLARKSQGLVLITGPTGSGKSATLAAMIDLINNEKACHIITLEDPIEYLHHHKKSMVNQREIHTDTFSFSNALRAALREDPDVILVGEMRDPETISTVITAAETGHLVFATLHTGDAAQTIDRIVDAFPSYQQQQMRTQLSLTLQGIVAQQLLPRKNGRGRVVAVEVLTATPAVRNLIREGKTHQIISVIQTGSKFGMQTMDMALLWLYRQGLISREEAIAKVMDPEVFARQFKSNSDVLTGGL